MPNCPVCNYNQTEIWSIAKDYEYFTSDDSYDYFHCPLCYCIFIHPIPLEQLQLIYPPNYYSFVPGKRNLVTSIKEWLDKRRFRKILSRIESPEIKVLDVGGGLGWIASLIKMVDPRVKQCQIVDINQEAGELARAKGHQYFEGRLEDFHSIVSYDFILMLNLIEHVKDPLLMLKKASLLLQDNGVILLKTPNTRSWDARLYRKKYWGGLHCPRHWIIFSEKAFRQMLEQTNLEIQSLEYTQGGPFWAFSIIISFFRKGWLNVSAKNPVVFHSLYPIVSSITALFDFLRSPFARTSQMFIVLKKNKVSTHGHR